jgi:hypothetical protein
MHAERVWKSPKGRFTIRLLPSEEHGVYKLELESSDSSIPIDEALPLDDIAELRRALDSRNLAKIEKRSRGLG